MEKKITTVKDLIEGLQRFDVNLPIEVAVKQYNQRYPMEWIPVGDTGPWGCLSSNGDYVRIAVTLPDDEATYKAVTTRKKHR